MVLQGSIYDSTENLSNQGSLEKHFLKEFFKEPINVPQRTFKPGFFNEPFPLRVLLRTYKCASKNCQNVSLRHHLWFHKEPFQPGFSKEPFPQRILQRTYKGVLNEKKVY
ncbi:hypothetical protein EYF80_065490 [Liparis tanakae]|uniref:Uncharacterized protein n=1 Tax=Liparis tanakae TaxID=230148 RepID=A0A4Z2E6I4_9TELE|nr:hypothetical protein EYF80_065490 [Liparis tanakae]